MSSQQLRIQMAGGGPYGFRLLGGDANPLTVSKIRPSSKAQISGLLEGDVILAVNDIICQGLSHPAATGLIESNNNGLTVLILRGKDARREAPAIISSLGSNVRRLSDEEATNLAQRHGNQVQTASDSYNGYSSDGGGGGGGGTAAFRLSAPPSGDSLKQTRISRRESRSEDLPPTTLPPRIVVVDEAATGPPSYYTREEKTSTDGGRTTRIVEEVKTEKFGGTTLTKVTKQEFTSYNSSGGGGPSTIQRSEDRQTGNPPPARGQVWADRGWTTASNVERRSVTTQPFEGARIVKITQEPAGNSNESWVVYEEDGIGGREPVSGRLGSRQVIPAIEIHFEPDEAGFVKTSAVQPDSNIKIRVGDEVNFQPKIQIQPAPNWDQQDSYEFQQHPPPNLKTYQAPRIEVERKVISSTHTQSYPSEQRQPSRIEVHSYGSSNQPVVGISSERQFQEIGNRGFGYEQSYNENVHPSRVIHAQPQPKQEFPAKSDNYPSYDQRERYNDAIHSQNDYKQQQQQQQQQQPPRPQTGSNPHEGYYPEDCREYTAVVHNPNHPTRNKPVRTETHVNKFNARPSDQHGSEAVEGPPYGYPQTGYRPQSQPRNDPGSPQYPFGREAGEQHAPFSSAPAAQQYGYGTFPGARNHATKGKQAETTYDDEPILPQRLPGTRDMLSKKVTWNQPESQYRAYVEPDRFDVPAEAGRPDAVRDRPAFPGPTGRPAVRQVERVQIGATQKWTPGSKLLPTKQPATDAREIKGGTAVGNYENQRRDYAEYEDVYRPPAEEGWYEVSAGTAPADARNRPDEVPSRGYEAPSRGYDQRRPGSGYPPAGPTNVRYSWAGYPSEQQQQQPDWQDFQGGGHHHPGAQNTWNHPSDEIRGRYPGDYVDDDWEGPNDVEPMYGQRGDWGRQPEPPSRAPPPPPPGPPFAPGMMAGRPPHPPPQETRAPPPPAAPPIDQLKVYRGNVSSDGGGYGLTSLEERVKVANSMALSVLAPENRNSKGQKMFIRRRENSHKWTKEGPDPVPEKKAPQQQQQHWGAQGQNDQNAWAPPPRFPEQARPAYPPHHAPSSGPLPHVYQGGGAPQRQESSAAYSLADDVASSGGKGGQLFAKRKAKSEKWTSYESPGSQPLVESPAAGKKFGVIPPFHAAPDQRPPVGVKWPQQPAFGPSSSYNQGPQTPKLAPGPSQAPQSYKTVRFQGPPPAFSSSPAPSYGQLPGPRQPPKFGPKQFGGKVSVSRSVGFTDL